MLNKSKTVSKCHFFFFRFYVIKKNYFFPFSKFIVFSFDWYRLKSFILFIKNQNINRLFSFVLSEFKDLSIFFPRLKSRLKQTEDSVFSFFFFRFVYIIISNTVRQKKKKSHNSIMSGNFYFLRKRYYCFQGLFLFLLISNYCQFVINNSHQGCHLEKEIF